MTPLPIVRNECVPNCGQCCGGATPAFENEVEPIFRFLKEKGKKSEKQLRWWNRDLTVCPFLTMDKKCFIYPVRPETCSAFGHIKFPPERAAEAERLGVIDMKCPREMSGEAYFDSWSMEKIEEFDKRHGVRRRGTKMVPLAFLGMEIMKSIKNGKGVEVPYLTSEEWYMLMNEAKRAWKTTPASSCEM